MAAAHMHECEWDLIDDGTNFNANLMTCVYFSENRKLKGVTEFDSRLILPLIAQRGARATLKALQTI